MLMLCSFISCFCLCKVINRFKSLIYLGLYKNIIFLALCLTTVVYSCPTREELGRHCTCSESRMLCSRMNKQEEFISAIEAIVKHRTKLSGLSIMFSSELDVPNNLFNNTHIEQVKVLFLTFSVMYHSLTITFIRKNSIKFSI